MFGFSLRYYLDSNLGLSQNFTDTVWIVGADGQAISKFEKYFFSKNFRSLRNFFLPCNIWKTEQKLFLGQNFFVPEKKIVSLKKTSFEIL